MIDKQTIRRQVDGIISNKLRKMAKTIPDNSDKSVILAKELLASIDMERVTDRAYKKTQRDIRRGKRPNLDHLGRFGNRAVRYSARKFRAAESLSLTKRSLRMMMDFWCKLDKLCEKPAKKPKGHRA